MRHILNRTGLLFVILLSLLAVTGCSTGPRQEANQAIERANEEISAHDELFDEARNSYAEARQSIREDGESTGEAESISDAREALEEARSRLEEAQGEISGIQELDVSEELSSYSRTLEEALAAQIRAEEREIAFYELLEEDPTLEENRDRAREILAEAEEAYAEAEEGYREASRIADSAPAFAAPESG